MKLIMLIAKTYLLFNWIWMKVKYGEWSAVTALAVIGIGLVIAVAVHWKGVGA